MHVHTHTRYTKRGLSEGPCGERLEEPLETSVLEPGNAISILISSDFLKMDTLVRSTVIKVVSAI